MDMKRREAVQLSAVIALGLIVMMLLRNHGPVGQDVRQNTLAQKILADRSSPNVAQPNADLTLVVFTDYRCPACRKAYPEMRKAVAKDGRLRVVYKDWPIFGEKSERAAAVALASETQDIYPQVHHRLMTGRVETDDDLKVAVQRSGGDWSRLINDLARRRSEIVTQLAHNKRQAFELGLPGTPGYLIGSVLVRGAMTEGEFLRAFKRAREAR